MTRPRCLRRRSTIRNGLSARRVTAPCVVPFHGREIILRRSTLLRPPRQPLPQRASQQVAEQHPGLLQRGPLPRPGHPVTSRQSAT
ncbi:hypothetical protein ACFOHY_22090 [Rhizobium rosettiformans]|uniref:hypothetical protein n=1 Tax=Rhizobium rosettiformans TaxID=1368430 RepID=UPI00360B828E